MVYVMVGLVIVGRVSAIVLPSLDSCASTINNERSDSTTAGPRSTAQVRVTADPTMIGLTGSLLRVTEDGCGTTVSGE